MALSEAKRKQIEEEEKYRARIVSKYHSPIRKIEKKQNRNKIAAALLAIFLGGFGIHKFYLGRPGWGILYLLFCWTFIPALIGFIEGILYLVMSDESFEKKYS